MAYALGYAGGYADIGAEPEPPGPAVGGGASGTLVRTRWVPRQAQPAPAPVSISVTAHFEYLAFATVKSVSLAVRLAVTPWFAVRAAALTMSAKTSGFTPAISAKVANVQVDSILLTRFAYEVRELMEIAVALNVWK